MRDAARPAGPLTRASHDWRITAEKPPLRRLSVLLRPPFAMNHQRAMRQGERGLALELARRHAVGDATLLAAIPAPHGPTFPHGRRRRVRAAG